jgi:hypothetical protein
MYVKTEDDGLQSIKLENMDNRADFSSNNIARVAESDGKTLIAEVDHISEHEPNNND